MSVETRVFKKPTKLVNVQAYQAKFGHLPAPEAYKFLTMDELEAQAAQAIKDNKPVKDWETRSQSLQGTSLDGFTI